MKTSLSLTIARRIGIGLAICVPALVVAQTLPNFGRNQVLQAEQLNALVSAISALQANAGVAFTKADLYTISDPSELTPQNGTALAQAICANANDILVSCRCQGLQGESNSLQFDLRQAGGSNRKDGTSFCICQGVNVGDNNSRTLVASGECLTVP